MSPDVFLPIANHLWQSTLFAAIAGLLTLLLRNNRAHTRYCLWLVASLKFLVPFSLFVTVGSQLAPRTAIAPAYSSVPLIIEQVHEPFGSAVSIPPMPTPQERRTSRSARFLVVPIVVAFWAVGFGILVFSWWRKWRRLRNAIRAAVPVSLPLSVNVPVLSSASFVEPGVFGVFRSVLLLPAGIEKHLAPEELEAILAHESCHVRRRDNLATAIHMVVEAVFWFHPLVWWLGAWLMDERERACDEEVLRMGSTPEAYAAGILKTCELYLRSPLDCVAGVTGANLKTRIEAIMNNRPTLKLNVIKRVGLAVAGIFAIAIPIVIGVMNAPVLRAQTQTNLKFEVASKAPVEMVVVERFEKATEPAPRAQAPTDLRFEVASVRRVEVQPTERGVPVFFPTGGVGTSSPLRITYRGAWLKNLIIEAFGVRGDQISGLDSVASERYDIVTNIPEGTTKEQFNIMLGNLLRDRFHLRFHMESKSVSVYALRVGKDGPKFKESPAKREENNGGLDAQGFPILPPDREGMFGMPANGEMHLTVQGVPMAEYASSLDSRAGRPVIDETGLKGKYDFKIHFEFAGRPAGAAPVSADPHPTIFDALEAQLGLKLESSTSTFPRLIVDSIDREPTEN
jgi:bla regulator protein BlaR1